MAEPQSTQGEIWKPVVRYENAYHVSNHGNVKRVNIKTVNNKPVAIPVERQLKLQFQKSGHAFVCLSLHNKQRNHRVHTLVLESFIGCRPVGLIGRHRDGNPQNNLLSNLRWSTWQENSDDRIRHGTVNEGERHGHAKLKDQEVRAIRAIRDNLHWTYQQLGDAFLVSRKTVARAAKRESWDHVV